MLAHVADQRVAEGLSWTHEQPKTHGHQRSPPSSSSSTGSTSGSSSLRKEAQELAREGHGRAAAGPASGLVERDAMVHRAAGQLHALDAEAEGLVFGRLDFDDGETYHIGRLGVRDDDREPLLVDWRAPAAAPFYRATSRRTARRGAPPGHHLPRARGHRPRRRRADPGRGRRPAGARRGRAAGRAAPVARPAHARHRHHHPAGAGRGDPGAGPRRHPHHRRSRDRQDPGRAAPGGVPALHRPRPVRRRPDPGGRPVDGVHRRTSAGCCPRSARTACTCARSASWSRASPPPAATARRSPRSRAASGCWRCWPS